MVNKDWLIDWRNRREVKLPSLPLSFGENTIKVSLLHNLHSMTLSFNLYCIIQSTLLTISGVERSLLLGRGKPNLAKSQFQRQNNFWGSYTDCLDLFSLTIILFRLELHNCSKPDAFEEQSSWDLVAKRHPF